MPVSPPTKRLPRAILVLAALGAAACGGTDTTQPADHASLHEAPSLAKGGNSGNAAGLVKSVHAATARFHATVQATRAGYVPDSPCVAAPPGGMGFHWVNHSLADPAFDPLRPEALLYAPNAHGKLKLVGVEYIVIDVGQPAPTFAGQPFNVGGTPVPVPHWSLHVWVHKSNPSGLFAPFNPDVICPAP